MANLGYIGLGVMGGLAVELGRSVKMPLPTTSVANEYLTAGRAIGLEKQDFAAIFQVLAKLSGVNE